MILRALPDQAQFLQEAQSTRAMTLLSVGNWLKEDHSWSAYNLLLSNSHLLPYTFDVQLNQDVQKSV